MVIVTSIIGLGATTVAAADADVVVASGTLRGQFLAEALFHIDEFWISVPADTEFNRWLSRGLGHTVVVRLMTDPSRFADVKDVRVLGGTLMHGLAPVATPNTVDAVGRVPAGDSPVVHILFLRNDLTGSFSPVTFQTADLVTAAKFDAYDDAPINIVIQIQ